MAKFFNNLQNFNLYADYCNILDWLLNDSRFFEGDGWNKGFVASFTKKVLKLPYINQSDYQFAPIKDLLFKNNKQFTIIFSSNEGQGKGLIKHIRNAIAHGNANISCKNCILWVELCDFNKKKDKTAYIHIPIETLKEIYYIYQSIEKKIKKAKEKIKNETINL